MEITEKIHLTFGELDPERLQSVATTCLEMRNPLRLHLAFCKKDQHRLKIIRARQKEAQEKITEMAIKSQYAVNLYYQHLDVEYKKAFSFQPSNLPDTPDDTSIFNVKALNCLTTFKVNIPSMTTHRWPNIPTSIIFLLTNN